MQHFGLTPESKVLDVGCGCLRGGRKIIPELNEACYFGIEPNKSMLKDGMEISLDPDVVLAKKPRFDTNAEWNFGVFNTKFDFVIARSIWSHASKSDIRKMLEEFSKMEEAWSVIHNFLPQGRNSNFWRLSWKYMGGKKPRIGQEWCS